jgi:hypothetical protein
MPKLSPHQCKNFDTLMRAARNGHVALSSVRRKDDESPVAAICAVSIVDGEYQLTPFAVMVDQDPFDLFYSPTETEIIDWRNFSMVVTSEANPKWSLEWEWIGEGDDGDYDDSNKDDSPRLRADLCYEGDVVDDGSYCTLAKPGDPPEHIEAVSHDLLNAVTACGHTPEAGRFYKKLMEEWTWKTELKAMVVNQEGDES